MIWVANELLQITASFFCELYFYYLYVIVGGTTGEHMSLHVSERKKLIYAWIEAGHAAGLRIQVQVGGAPFQDVMELVSNL